MSAKPVSFEKWHKGRQIAWLKRERKQVQPDELDAERMKMYLWPHRVEIKVLVGMQILRKTNFLI